MSSLFIKSRDCTAPLKSLKRELDVLPIGRPQIGKFGIGKLATYVLANRLTHIHAPVMNLIAESSRTS
jgi:hypothetical protein